MIVSILFFPKLSLGKLKIDTYWVITLLGAILVLFFGGTDFSIIKDALLTDSAVNPIKILVLFLSMTILSIDLDELGFFRYLANVALKHASKGQVKLFFYLYILVSILTVFTSNDIIILSFTPFICYFAKNAKIDPIPYLAAEFIAANTWSMALMIGNPTNIYLSTASGIGFLEYIQYSILPTLFAGLTSLCVLYLFFRKKLRQPMNVEKEEVVIEDKVTLWIGVIHLFGCTILLAIGPYVGLEMWLVSLCAVISLFLCNIILSIIRKRKPVALGHCLKRAPYPFIPFVLSMFIMIVVLADHGITHHIAEAFGSHLPILKYGITSFFACNLINNIPMSVLFSSVISSSNGMAGMEAIFATIIGSNIGALFTPIGALAGIMWGSLISKYHVKFGYVEFLKMGVIVALPTLGAALFGLYLVTLF